MLQSASRLSLKLGRGNCTGISFLACSRAHLLPLSMSAGINASAFAQTLKKLVPTKGLPPVLKPRCGNLYEVLSRTPTGGIGMEVHQTRWSEKNIPNCYWVITRSQFKLQGTHGKAWGRLHWKGSSMRLLLPHNYLHNITIIVRAVQVSL